MFGMSSREFWEEEPQLYWAYRFSYEKQVEYEAKMETERMKLACWLQGKASEIAVSTALNNAFNKKKRHFPTYQEFFKDSNDTQDSPVKAQLAVLLDGIEDKEERGKIEFDFWARI